LNSASSISALQRSPSGTTVSQMCHRFLERFGATQPRFEVVPSRRLNVRATIRQATYQQTHGPRR
jgi:hypothetical protein